MSKQENILLCDFGSTWTKLTAVDRGQRKILGTAAAYTTVETDLQEGFAQAKQNLFDRIGRTEFAEIKACSSAAGGLRMIVSGLVPELTVEAAKIAALGAGAKIIKVYAHEMIRQDLEEIRSLKPDIFLLTGGTDGGNKNCILHNAEKLAELKPTFPILIAGNRNAADEIADILKDCNTFFCENVLPSVNSIQVEQVQQKIREIFLEQIVRAKGISFVQEIVSNIIMPTPVAMLKAMELLADGFEQEPGIGPLLAVDLGGATTDVYSVCDGYPRNSNTILRGLEEPYGKRTVEGDLGMRYSLKGIFDEYKMAEISARMQLEESDIDHLFELFSNHKDLVPRNQKERRFDQTMAALAVEKAVERHAGTLTEVYTPVGKTYLQQGKDLSEIKSVILTGGALIHHERLSEIKAAIEINPLRPHILKPKEISIYKDQQYILSAMGLLAEIDPEAALLMMKEELYHAGNQK